MTASAIFIIILSVNQYNAFFVKTHAEGGKSDHINQGVDPAGFVEYQL